MVNRPAAVLLLAVAGLAAGCQGSALRRQCIGVLRAGLDAEQDTVVNHAGEALIFAGQAQGLEARFVRMLQRQEPDREARDVKNILAARALYQLGRREQVRTILAVLDDRQSPRRHTAAEALGKLGYDQAHDQIRRAIAERPDDPVLWAYGTGAMAKCGDGQAIADLLDRGFDSPHWNVRRITANDLGAIRLPQALPRIRQMLATEERELVRVDAAGAMLAYDDFASLAALEAGLQSESAEVRSHAVRAFQATRDRSLIPRLKPLLEDPDPETRVRAAEAIVHILAPTAPRGGRVTKVER